MEHIQNEIFRAKGSGAQESLYLRDCIGKDYRTIKLLRNNADYKVYMTYLNYAPEIQAMIYTTNWIERLNRDFRRVTRMRTAMPNEESVLTLMGSVAMDHKAFDRALPNITVDKTLFPD